MKRTIAGYTDRISAAPGEQIDFKVSVEDGAAHYRAEIVRLICTDSHRDGPGQIERAVRVPVNGDYPARRQVIHRGSYASVPDLPALASFTMQAFVWPTLLDGRRQSVMGHWNEAHRTGAVLGLNERGEAALRLGFGSGAQFELASAAAVLEREWVFLGASYDAGTGELRLHQVPRRIYPGTDIVTVGLSIEPMPAQELPFAPFTIAAHGQDATAMHAHFNGKIDRPRLATRALDRQEMDDLLRAPRARFAGASYCRRLGLRARDADGSHRRRLGQPP